MLEFLIYAGYAIVVVTLFAILFIGVMCILTLWFNWNKSNKKED